MRTIVASKIKETRDGRAEITLPPQESDDRMPEEDTALSQDLPIHRQSRQML
jgi:hypothetical protein